MKNWIVYYDDDTSKDSDSDVWSIPRTGVEIIIIANEKVGYEILRTVGDYFVYDEQVNSGGWRITDLFGVYDHLVTAQKPLVLFGRQMRDERFEALLKRVQEECGPKSGWIHRENRPIE